MNAATLKELGDGAVFGEIKGTITKVWERKSGTGQHGEWSFQNCGFTIDGGDKITLKFSGFPDQSDLAGKPFHAKSTKGDKGTHGLKVEIYRDKPVVVVTKSAQILGDGNSESATPASTSKPAAAPPHAPSQYTEASALLAAKKFVALNATLCKIALVAVTALEKQHIEANGGPGKCPGFDATVFNTLLNAHLFGSSHNGWYDHLPLNVKYPSLEIVHPEGSK